MLCPQRTDDHAVAVLVPAGSEVTSRTAAAVLVSKDRLSIQYKHRPDYGTVVAPLDVLLGGEPPRYKPLNTGSEYLAVLRTILGG